MNDLVILINRANNGIGLAIVAIPPGESPYSTLARWFEMKHYKKPLVYAKKHYEVVRLISGVTNYLGIVSVLEYFDGDTVTGYDDPTRYDL